MHLSYTNSMECVHPIYTPQRIGPQSLWADQPRRSGDEKPHVLH